MLLRHACISSLMHCSQSGLRMRLPPPPAQKLDPKGLPTKSAHPARFSPDDKFSRERVTLKKRFGILPTQLPPHEM